MPKGLISKKLNSPSLKVGLVVSRFNELYTRSLEKWCRRALKECGVKPRKVKKVSVPGSFELLFGARALMKHWQPDVVVCLGCLIKGETLHFEYICQGVAQGIAELNVDEEVSVIFGVLTCLTEEQARERTRNDKTNLGYQWGYSAVEMGLLRKS